MVYIITKFHDSNFSQIEVNVGKGVRGMGHFCPPLPKNKVQKAHLTTLDRFKCNKVSGSASSKYILNLTFKFVYMSPGIITAL